MTRITRPIPNPGNLARNKFRATHIPDMVPVKQQEAIIEHAQVNCVVKLSGLLKAAATGEEEWWTRHERDERKIKYIRKWVRMAEYYAQLQSAACKT